MRAFKRINRLIQGGSSFLVMIFFSVLLFFYQFQSEPPASRADTIIKNGKIATLNQDNQFVSAVAIKGDEFIAIGSDQEILNYKGPDTKVIDVKGKTVIPGLNDSHSHLIRGGLNYNLELRWDGVRSLNKALEMLREQAKRTPEGQWVRVVGGWSEYQFKEKRLPTLEEINEAAPDTPVFVMYLYSLGFLNKAAIEALGYTKDTKYPGGEIQLDKNGNPTGLLIAKPSALILYSTLLKGPNLSTEDQLNSTLHFFRELNRFGLTSSIDAGGGGQNFPNDYQVAKRLAQEGKLTIRISYYLFAQEKGRELENYEEWIKIVKPGHNGDMFRPNGYVMEGAGENLTWSAADFENFLEPRPTLSENMEGELKAIVQLLVKNRWPFRIHATYDESIERFLNVFEEVNKETPFNGLRWTIDHAETISERNLNRVKALGGGIAVQNRMMFQGEHFVERYGAKAGENAPPIKKMLDMGIPVGLGTDCTRVSSYNPWLALYWITSGKTWGGTVIYPEENRLSRVEALRLMTEGSAWFSGEEGVKGTIEVGKYADLAVLSADYFSVPEEEIKNIESVLTIVGGKLVYAKDEFKDLAPWNLPVSPAWSPVAEFGSYVN
ncbi:MAG TPA: amidohydrolase [Thermodesulfobacteriota bacterium]|nr:amidohydrolase [Thermodesulfobacteriota bacterium]